MSGRPDPFGPGSELAGERRSVGQTVLTFLQSVGRPAEAELYLRLFRSLPRGRFALVVPTRAVLDESIGTLTEQLGFLTELGLFPSVAVEARPGEVGPNELVEALRSWEVDAEVLDATWGLERVAARVDALAAERRIAILAIDPGDERAHGRLALAIQPRKVIVLRERGGLGPHGFGTLEVAPGHVLETHQSGISALNLRSDRAPLVMAGLLTDDDQLWLGRAEAILEEMASGGTTQTTVSVASPLSLLRELFTVRGEGTLVKLGSVVVRADGYDEVDRARLGQLLEESFGRAVRPAFWQRPPARIYLESNYRGVALLEPGVEATYLSKFAVLQVARGEGVGQDLWREMVRDTPRLFWRCRPNNPIDTWYTAVCHGMHRTSEWHVYYRGVPADLVPAVVFRALEKEPDFL